MANDNYNIQIEIETKLGKIENIVNELKNIEKASENLAKNVNASSTIIQGAFLNIGTHISNLALKLPSLATASIKAFGEQEMATQKLAAAIRSHGGNLSEVLPIMQQFASQIQSITTYGDEQVLAMQSMATSMGVSSEQMESVIQSAIGLATALNMDVMTAIKASSAAVQGKTTMLQEYIPSLSKCKTEEEKLAEVQKLSASGFAQAKAEADSTIGKLTQCSNAWGDVAEVIGGTFAPIVKDVADALKFVCGWISENETGARLLTGTLTSLAIGFAFTKIGGLTNVVAMFKQVRAAIFATELASKNLNASLRANPLGLVATAVSAFIMVVSHLKDKEKSRYEANIKDSEDYRKSLESEIEDLKTWGITEDANKKRIQEIRTELEKLNEERNGLGTEIRIATGAYDGRTISTKTYSPEEQKQLDNIKAKSEALNKVLAELADVKGKASLAEKTHADVLKKSNDILAQSSTEMRVLNSATAALEISRKKYTQTQKEISALEEAFANNTVSDKVRVASAEQLRATRKKLYDLGKDIIAQEIELSEKTRNSAKVEQIKKQYDLETQLAGAIIRSEREDVASLKTQLEQLALQQKRLDLIDSYIASQKSEIQSAEDLKRIKAEAQVYANAQITAEEKSAQTQKWLNDYLETTKSTQSSLELDILRARKQGDEALAREKEAALRIAQLSSEIFENTRKEGMSRKELERLQDKASEQAKERYNLEKSVTDEVQRQNLAKNAQSQIEDILLTKKIEQLKAEGKLVDAKALEQEREIKRTLASLEGVSEDDKNTLAEAMRQTNDYRDYQEENRKKASESSSGGYFSSGGNHSGGSGFTGGQFRGGGGSSSRLRGATPPSKSRTVATVSEKNMGIYEEWKSAGGEKGTGKNWYAFRDARRAELDNPNFKSEQKAKAQANAIATLSGVQGQASKMASRVKLTGAVAEAANSQSSAVRAEKPQQGQASSNSQNMANSQMQGNRSSSQQIKSTPTPHNNSSKKDTKLLERISRNTKKSSITGNSSWTTL